MNTGAVAAGHPQTAAAAWEMLADGGNAYDAAAAALAASFVTEPALSSPGGGGFLLAHPVGRPPQILDFFTQTPGRTAERDASLDFHPVTVDFGTATQDFHVGRASAAVPGAIPGLCAIVDQLGRLPIARILEPAIRHARDGVPVAPMQAHIIDVISPILTLTPGARALFGSSRQPGTTRQSGEPLAIPELADTLEALAREGERLFLEGPIAAAMSSLCADGGLLRAEDFSRYRVAWRAPLSLEVLGGRVLTNPPPSAGGPLLLYGLALADRLAHPPTPGELATIMALTAEARDASGLAQAVDASHAETLLDPAALDHGWAALSDGRRALKRGGTTHFSVVDSEGNTAACTVSNGEGCGHMVPGAGFMLNNMLGEEDLNPAGFFRWAPDRRVASMMAPTLAECPDGRRIALGSAGSNRIRTALLQVLCNLLSRHMPLAEAIVAPRLHTEGGQLEIEGGWTADEIATLTETWPAQRCWTDRSMFFGGVQAVEMAADGTLSAAGDPRRGGAALP